MPSGGSSGPSEVTQISSNLPEYARPYYEDLLGRTTFETARPYEAFPGQRLADFNPMEMQSFQGVSNFAQQGTPGLDQAMGVLGGTPQIAGRQSGGYQAISGPPAAVSDRFLQSDGQPGGLLEENPFTQNLEHVLGERGREMNELAGSTPLAETAIAGVEGFQPGEYDPGSLSGNQLTGYMDPYQQAVTDIQKREATRQSEMMGQRISDAATQAGGLGGYREAIMQAERERNLGQQLDDIQAFGSQQNFLQARQAFEADKSRELASRQFGAQTMRDRAQLGLQGVSTLGQDYMRRAQTARDVGDLALGGYGAIGQDMSRRAGVAGLMGDLSGTQQNLTLERLSALQQAGQMQRSLQQQGLDIGYQDFLRQQAFPREQLGLYSSILQGVPFQPGSTTAQFGTRPSDLQQLLGTGIGGLGLYNALGSS